MLCGVEAAEPAAGPALFVRYINMDADPAAYYGGCNLIESTKHKHNYGEYSGWLKARWDRDLDWGVHLGLRKRRIIQKVVLISSYWCQSMIININYLLSNVLKNSVLCHFKM
jgi:hypothetical protein